MFLGAMDSRSGLAFWMEFGGQTMLDSYAETGGWEIIPRDHLAFLRSGRNYHETDTHIFVHANYRPNRPLAEQQTATLRWEHLEPARAARHYSGKTVVVGHTPQKSGEILDLGFVVCIDTYCHGGGWLTALDVTSGATWQANERGQLRFTQRLPHGNATSTPNSEGDSTSAPRPAPSAGPPPGEVA
jgi:serine/threonine protein phosphatase 1